MLKDAQWWREYRKENLERLRAYKKARYHGRKAEAEKLLKDGEYVDAALRVEKRAGKDLAFGCMICGEVGKHRGFHQGVSRLFCEEHFKV